MVQIFNQVGTTLDSNRQSHQRVVDAEFGSFFVRDGGVSHERRTFRQGFHRAERLGQLKQCQLKGVTQIMLRAQ